MSVTMTELPICLRDHEVRGILDGTCTQLRRVVRPQPQPPGWVAGISVHEFETANGDLAHGFFDEDADYICPLGSPGDLLWGRETWRRADNPLPRRWLSPVTMPKWACRIWLRVAGVRVERDDAGEWQWVVDVERVER